jgi:hypothetical protein
MLASHERAIFPPERIVRIGLNAIALHDAYKIVCTWMSKNLCIFRNLEGLQKTISAREGSGAFFDFRSECC